MIAKVSDASLDAVLVNEVVCKKLKQRLVQSNGFAADQAGRSSGSRVREIQAICVGRAYRDYKKYVNGEE